MKIPIQNIYYLLCYAWNKFQEKDLIDVSKDDYEQLPDLLSKVLINGCNRLIKQGLDRNYIEVSQQYRGIKGKLDFSESIKRQSFLYGQTECRFDEFSPDILPNQLLKGTVVILIRTKDIDPGLRKQLYSIVRHFSGVSDIEPSLVDFQKVHIHRNNSFYDFLLTICRFIIEQIALDEKSDKYKFQDLLRNQRTMQRLYEEFVRNFYSRKQTEFKVKSETITWKAVPVGKSNPVYLPHMKTDISLISTKRKIIIDTKYYSEALRMNQYNDLKFHSSNLYQLFAYLKNSEYNEASEINKYSSGILLYPTTSQELDETFLIDTHKISVCTVNLATDWRNIEERLLKLLEK